MGNGIIFPRTFKLGEWLKSPVSYKRPGKEMLAHIYKETVRTGVCTGAMEREKDLLRHPEIEQHFLNRPAYGNTQWISLLVNYVLFLHLFKGQGFSKELYDGIKGK